MKKRAALLGLVLASGTFANGLMAADHTDAPGAIAEPLADITDLYAWSSADATKVNLIMNVFPGAGDTATFGTDIVYRFVVGSGDANLTLGETTEILCKFYDTNAIECWAGDEYVEGDPSAEAGITSESGKMTVFAGLRDDPFFMEFTGFVAVSETVRDLVENTPGALNLDAAGCPQLDGATSTALVTQLGQTDTQMTATNTFAGANVLSLVVQVDKDVVNGGGPVLQVWSSTHMAGN